MSLLRLLVAASGRSNQARGLLASRRSLFVQTEATPNEHSLKFTAPELADKLSRQNIRSMEFTDEDGAARAPLAKAILALPFVKSVFYGSDFITVEKSREGGIRWDQLKPQICGVLMDHLLAQQPILLDDSMEHVAAAEIPADDAALLQEVQTVMDTRIRPIVQGDGGDIEVVRLEKGYVHLRLRGACRSCSSSAITLRNGVESMLMHYLEDVKGVVHVKDEVEEIAQHEFDRFEHDRASK